MNVYNVTFHVNASIVSDWMLWAEDEFIPSLLKTDCFSSARFTKVTSLFNPDFDTFSIQMTCEQVYLIDRFQKTYENELLYPMMALFKNEVVYFITVMKVLSDHQQTIISMN